MEMMKKAISLEKATTSAVTTNFQLCIICQQNKQSSLQNVTSLDGLKVAIEKRQDDIGKRLQSFVVADTLIHQPMKWHGECRRWYTLKKSCDLAEKRRMVGSSMQISYDVIKNTQMKDAEYVTRSQVGSFDYLSQCIVCEKPFTKRNKASIAMTEGRGQSLKKKAEELNDRHMLDKIQAYPGVSVDLVALDVRYHMKCINAYMNKRPKSVPTDSDENDDAFISLIAELKTQLIECRSVVYLSTIRDKYRALLLQKGVIGGEMYRAAVLKRRLQSEFGDSLTFWPQPGGSDYVCSSKITVGDAFKLIEKLKCQVFESDNQSAVIQEAAKLLHKDAKSCKFDQFGKSSGADSFINMSHSNAIAIIPPNILDFTVSLLSGKEHSRDYVEKDQCTEDLNAKAINLAQHILYAVCKVPSPLTLGSAFHIYNETRSKGLITLLNHLSECVSYDTFQRYLTSACEKMIEDEHEAGIFIPPAINGCNFVHFAIDNADWHEKTPDGTTFHAMTTNVYGYEQNFTNSTLREPDRAGVEHLTYTAENMCILEDQQQTFHVKDSKLTPVSGVLAGKCQLTCDQSDEGLSFVDKSNPSMSLSSAQYKGKFGDIPKLKTSKSTKRSLDTVVSCSLEPHYVSLLERKKARTLKKLTSEDLATTYDPSIHHMNMVWQLCRSVPIKIMALESTQCPSWNTFFTKLTPKMPATVIGYGPMIPSSPTNSSVVHKGLEYSVKLASRLGMRHTVVTADQALYDIAYALREQAPPDDEIYSTLILMLGQFHLIGNFIGAIGKIMRNSGAEDILVQSGVCKLGTANKIFGPSGDYYQSMRAHKLLREAMAKLHLDSFGEWYMERNPNAQFCDLNEDLENILHFLEEDQSMNKLQRTEPNFPIGSVAKLQIDMDLYDEEKALKSPTHNFWRTYIKMVDIVLRFTASHRKGDWEQSLAEAGNMLPFIVAAGHHNYSYSLPLYLKEMNNLPNTAPEVYNFFKKGHFVVRRKSGSFNGVPTDMALEQTYNRDVKESPSGLSGITLDAKARTKWLYTKPVLAEVSSQFKVMMNLPQAGSATGHHDEGKQEMVVKIIDCIKQCIINPFETDSQNMLNISTGQAATHFIQKDLEQVEEIGKNAIQRCLAENSEKVPKIKLHTFEELQAKHKRPVSQKQKEQHLENEVVILKRILQLQAIGKDIDIERLIGEYECAKVPPALFETNGLMRKSNKASWLTVIAKETKYAVEEILPESNKRTSLIVDTMAFIQQHQFLEEETFDQYQMRLLRKLIQTAPENCDNIHIPGDRYDHKQSSTKEEERQRRNDGKPQTKYQVTGNIKTPQWKLFMASDSNKAALLDYICSSWEKPEVKRSISTNLYLSGGFQDEMKSICITSTNVRNIPDLSSCHEECDTRIILHAVYSIQQLGAKRIVIYSSDTDVIVLLLYYASTLLNDVDIWVRKSQNQWLPIHELKELLGPYDCKIQPFLHAFSGKDDTNFIYDIGKAKVLKLRQQLELNLLSSFGEDNHYEVTEELVAEARKFLMALYSRKTFTSLAALRAHLFISGGKSKDLRALPPTEDAFKQHLLRSLYATLVQKQAHLKVPVLPPPTAFGWKMGISHLQPVTTVLPSFPEIVQSLTSCNCYTSQCKRYCSCKRAQVPCCLACKCEGKKEKCARVEALITLNENTSDESDVDPS